MSGLNSKLSVATAMVVAAKRRGPVLLCAQAPIDWACIWISALALLLIAGATGNGHPVSRPPALSTAALPSPVGASSGQWLPTQDSWNDQLSNPAFWANRKSGGKSSGGSNWSPPSGLTKVQPSFGPSWSSPKTVSLPGGSSQEKRGSKPASRDDDDGDDDDGKSSKSSSGKTYRTMCVRLCDGFYVPVSFATTKDNFERDADTCEKSCGGATDARLFTYRNPGSDVEEMEDLDGKPYKKLPTAFLFRTKYDAACKCRPHPWEEASQTRHKTYALAAAAQKGDASAAKELNVLKIKMQDEARALVRDKAAAAKLKQELAEQEKAAAKAAAEAEKAAKRQAKAAKGRGGDGVASGANVTDLGSGARKASGQQAMRSYDATSPPRSSSEAWGTETRAGRLPDPAAAPAGGRTSVIILRYGVRTPVEVSVPSNRPASTPAPWRRDADARTSPTSP